jgi:hypothetical protein
MHKLHPFDHAVTLFRGSLQSADEIIITDRLSNFKLHLSSSNLKNTKNLDDAAEASWKDRCYCMSHTLHRESASVYDFQFFWKKDDKRTRTALSFPHHAAKTNRNESRVSGCLLSNENRERGKKRKMNVDWTPRRNKIFKENLVTKLVAILRFSFECRRRTNSQNLIENWSNEWSLRVLNFDFQQ